MSILNETGEFLLDKYGTFYAIGFRGDANFIRRAQNFVVNRGICRSKLNCLTDNLYYVTTTLETLHHAIRSQIAGEIALAGTVPYKGYEPSDDEDIAPLGILDEEAIWTLAGERLEVFLNEKLIEEPFMHNMQYVTLPEYSVNSRR